MDSAQPAAESVKAATIEIPQPDRERRASGIRDLLFLKRLGRGVSTDRARRAKLRSPVTDDPTLHQCLRPRKIC
jgi:hypothetical protein